MRGSMREKKPGVWELRVYCGRDPLTGKHVSISRTFQGGKRPAERELARLVAANVGSGSDDASTADVAVQRVTVTELVKTHLARMEYSPTTLADYGNALRRYIEPTIGTRRINEVRPAMLDHLYAHFRDQMGLAPATIRKLHALLGGSFRTAVKYGWLTSNPALNASPPKVHKAEMQLPTVGEVGDVIAEADRYERAFGVFVRLAAATGARRGELCAVRWSDVDLDLGMLDIDGSIYVPKGGSPQRKDTKNHSKRSVALDPSTVDSLIAHRRKAEDLAEFAGTVVAADGYVFSDAPSGLEAWRPDRTSHAWDKVRERVPGLDGIRLHDLRHFQATMLLQSGVPVTDVSRRIGHRDTATTLNVYSKALAATDRRAASIMGDLLDIPRSAEGRL